MVQTENFIHHCEELLIKEYEEGIIETVALFNLLGLQTICSCEGHAKHRNEEGFDIYPSIVFRNEDSTFDIINSIISEYYANELPTEYQYNLVRSDSYLYLEPIQCSLFEAMLAQNSTKKRLYKYLSLQEQEKCYLSTRNEIKNITEFLKKKYLI